MPFWKRHQDEESVDLWLIVGLGNPGREYENTRHNVGFMVVERLAARAGLPFRGSKHRADVARGSVDGVPALLAIPLTYMNESGNAVSRLMRYYHIPVSRLLVICDDIDLPFGTIRIRPSGGSGGHNGLKSIIAALGTEEFARLRVGVSRPRDEAVRHVLHPFSAEEARLLPDLIDKAADAATTVLRAGVQVAMNQYNRDWLPALTADGG